MNAISLKSIDLPESLTTIGRLAFGRATALTSITIPKGVTTIGAGTFSGTTNLKSISLPVSLMTIGDYAFSNASALESITIPEDVTTIEEGTFYGAISLKSISLPDSLMIIGAGVFYNATALESIIIPEGVTTIGANAFSNASALKHILIPKGVTTIGENAFSSSGLTKIYLANSKTALDTAALTGLTVYGLNNSTAKAYATTNGLTFVEVSPPVTVTYDKNDSGGTLPVVDNISEIQMTTIGNKSEFNTEKKYVVSWNTRADGQGESYTIGNSYIFTENLTLYAQWEDKKVITLNYQNGTPNQENYVIPKEIFAQPTPPMKAKHRFEGWYTDATFQTLWDFTTPVTADGTLHAKWSYISSGSWTPPVEVNDLTDIADNGAGIQGTTSPNSTIRLLLAGVEIASGRSDNDGRFTIEIPAQQADVELTMIVTNAFGTTKTIKLKVLDKTAPPVETQPFSDQDGNISGKTEANAQVKIILNGVEIATITADANGNYSYVLEKQQAGTIIQIIATDNAGNETTQTLTVLDKTAPKVTVKPFSDKDKKITGKTEPKAKVKIYINGKLVKTVTADAKGNYSYTVPKKKAGTTIKIIATDKAGNPKTMTIKVLDKTAPAKPIVKAPTTKTATLTGKAEKGSTVYVYKKNKVIAKAKVNAKGNYSVKIPKQKVGTTLTLIARDQAKNGSKKTNIKVKKA